MSKKYYSSKELRVFGVIVGIVGIVWGLFISGWKLIIGGSIIGVISLASMKL